MNTELKNCQNCKQNFTIEPEDFQFYKKIDVPPPTWCPECRLERRLIWRNERVFFKRKDDASGKNIVSGFPSDVPFPIYERDYWWSDAWDPMQYGRDFDPSRPFLEQFRELLQVVPWPSRSVINMVNSEYSDQAGGLKNCYLCFNCDYLENSTYVVRGNTSKDCSDSLQVQGSELCYDSTFIDKSFRAFYSLDCGGSTDMWFSKQCVGCTNCFGCVNLKKKNYYIWNKPYSKEEYFKKLKEFNLGSRKAIGELKKKAYAFWNQFPSKYYRGIRNVNSSGDMLVDTKNTRESWWVSEAEDMRYCQALYLKSADCYDYTVWGDRASRIYECLTCGQEVDSLKFCFDCWPSSQELEYCLTCHSSSNLFGCIGLKKKQYCILNKQYSKEEYEKLRKEIIAQMNAMPYVDTKKRVYTYGEFFPKEFSPFAYNDTMLQDVFPLDESEAIAKGYQWRNPDMKEYEGAMKGDDIPDLIGDVTDEITEEVINCSLCNRAYRIVPAELDFHRRIEAPLSNTCINCRHIERFKFINPPRFISRKCECAGAKSDTGVYTNLAEHFHKIDHCPNTFETAYGTTFSEIVYCEECYQVEVV